MSSKRIQQTKNYRLHRAAMAEELGLPIWYVVSDTAFDVAKINCTSKTWVLRDYARKHAANGLTAYQEGLDFAESHMLPIGTAFCLLAGTTTFTNVNYAFITGSFKIKDREWAESVAAVYSTVTNLSASVRNARCLEACMAMCRVEGFEIPRLLRGAERCREKLVSYSTRDAYLEMFEAVYNHSRKQLFALKIQSLQAMRERNAITVATAKKQSV